MWYERDRVVSDRERERERRVLEEGENDKNVKTFWKTLAAAFHFSFNFKIQFISLLQYP